MCEEMVVRGEIERWSVREMGGWSSSVLCPTFFLVFFREVCMSVCGDVMRDEFRVLTLSADVCTFGGS